MILCQFGKKYVASCGMVRDGEMDDFGVFLGGVLKKGKYAVFCLHGRHIAPMRKSLATAADELGPSFLLTDRGCIFSR